MLTIRVGDELLKALHHPTFKKPLCLPAVLYDGVSNKEFIPLKEFISSPTSIYKSSWVPSPWSVVRWGLKRIGVLGEPGFGDKLETANIVVLRNVEVGQGRAIFVKETGSRNLTGCNE